jgi:hypothetical protein
MKHYSMEDNSLAPIQKVRIQMALQIRKFRQSADPMCAELGCLCLPLCSCLGIDLSPLLLETLAHFLHAGLHGCIQVPIGMLLGILPQLLSDIHAAGQVQVAAFNYWCAYRMASSDVTCSCEVGSKHLNPGGPSLFIHGAHI